MGSEWFHRAIGTPEKLVKLDKSASADVVLPQSYETSDGSVQPIHVAFCEPTQNVATIRLADLS